MNTSGREHWTPAATRDVLQARAELLATLRHFFALRGVLETETPYLSAAANPDPNIESIAVDSRSRRFLHTSPEFPMKRLLAGGSGAIYQICRVFRGGEEGSRHNPEFTMLEWYQPGFELEAMIQEAVDLVVLCLADRLESSTTLRLQWQEAFLRYAQLDPGSASLEELKECAQRFDVEAGDLNRDQWLDLLFCRVVSANFPTDRPVVVTAFPVAQAALAQVDEHARRFEVFVGDMELANGYHELLDPAEHRRRFEVWNQRRADSGQKVMPLDDRLLAAIDAGLPDCCGVALGVDRLLMLQTGRSDIKEVLAFPWSRA